MTITLTRINPSSYVIYQYSFKYKNTSLIYNNESKTLILREQKSVNRITFLFT